jgi:hypothetical protein
MIPHNYSISDFDTQATTTTHSSSSSSPSTHGHYFSLFDDQQPSTPRYSPINLSCHYPPSSSGSSSPSKVVGTCKNCSHTFRIRNRLTEFCSKGN